MNTIAFWRKSRLLLCVVLCVMLSGCDIIYRFLDKEGAQERDLIGEVVPNKKNLVIEEAQALLHLYGYNAGKIDGVLGLRTRNAIEKFQMENGIKQTRYLDRATWKKISLFKENRLVEDLHLNIPLIQKLLKTAGFNPGNIDGKMGKRTKRAVRDFQKAQGLKVDGKIGYKTLSQLAKYISFETQTD